MLLLLQSHSPYSRARHPLPSPPPEHRLPVRVPDPARTSTLASPLKILVLFQTLSARNWEPWRGLFSNTRDRWNILKHSQQQRQLGGNWQPGHLNAPDDAVQWSNRPKHKRKHHCLFRGWNFAFELRIFWLDYAWFKQLTITWFFNVW